ncbi:hypothetical protein JW964_04435 [candidate division KSB1 bacterium]|nr:hypothetical protein [candidate division KSB1 bacterium]
MNIQTQNTLLCIFLLILFFQQNGFTQNQMNDSGILSCRNMEKPITYLNNSVLPAYSYNALNFENKPVPQFNTPENSTKDLKPRTTINDTANIKKFYLRWGKSSGKKQQNKKYYLIIDRDSLKIAKFIQKHDKKQELIWQNLSGKEFWCQQFLAADSFLVPVNVGGHFYWTVFECKSDGKLNCIKKRPHQVVSYHLTGANLEIQRFSFEYSPWITRDDYHGELIVEVKNNGNQSAEEAWLTLTDSVLTPYQLDELINSKESNPVKTLARKQIKHIESGETILLAFPWRTPFLGKHKLRIQTIDQNEQVVYSQQSQVFLTIPKGGISTDDNPIAIKITQVSFEIPIITEISFDPNSNTVRPEYLHKKYFEPSLLVLANRLIQSPAVTVLLQGYSDANSDAWDTTLADKRSRAIKDSLINLGVQPEQIIIQRGQILPRLENYLTPEESQWIFEERRHVRMTIKSTEQEKLLNPIQYSDCEAIPQPVRFELKIKSFIPLKKGCVRFKCSELEDVIDHSDQTRVQNIPLWMPVKALADSNWLDKEITYYLTVTDSSGRTFKTQNQIINLSRLIVNKEHRMALPLKFAQSNLNFEFYWSRIFDQITNLFADPDKRLCFTGHACAIGSEVSNRLLSQKRAERFHAGLLEFIRKNHPEYYGLIKERMIPAHGFGESRPLTISQLNGEQILIGDNLHAMGRRLNRRIEVIFSQEDKLSNF